MKPIITAVSTFLALAVLAAVPAWAAAKQERMAVYLTVAGPVEVVRGPDGHYVVLKGRAVLGTRDGALTVQSYMSVGDAENGFDAMLLRRGVGDMDCPVVYDLLTVGPDGKYAVAPGFNQCSKLLDARVVGDRLQFELERKTGAVVKLEYDDAARKSGGEKRRVVKMKRIK